LVRDIRKKRDDARVRVEAVVEAEKSLVPATAPVTSAAQQPPRSPDIVISKVRGGRPQTTNGIVQFSGDGFGKLLEFWGLFASLSTVLELEAVPTIRKLEKALITCDPHLCEINSKLRNACSTKDYFDPNK
jgi:hypothetical protein